jgi:hypothetical protein
MMSRKPAALALIKDPHRTIEVACFLRLTLLRLTDASLALLDHQIATQWREARSAWRNRGRLDCAGSAGCSAISQALPTTKRSALSSCARGCAA